MAPLKTNMSKAKAKPAKVSPKKASKPAKVPAKPAAKALKVAKGPAKGIQGKQPKKSAGKSVEAPKNKILAKMAKASSKAVEAVKKALDKSSEKSIKAQPVVEKAPKVKAPKPLGKRAQAAAVANLTQVTASLRGGGAPMHVGPVSEEVCREVACEGLATTSGYCRLHYIKNWKKIKRKELILKEGKLNQYIEELVAKYPDKYIEAIRMDLASDKEFSKVIHDLELDESVEEFDFENESDDNIIDTIKRDFEDEGEGGF